MTKLAAVSYCSFRIGFIRWNEMLVTKISGLQVMEYLKKVNDFLGFLDYTKKKGSILQN